MLIFIKKIFSFEKWHSILIFNIALCESRMLVVLFPFSFFLFRCLNKTHVSFCYIVKHDNLLLSIMCKRLLNNILSSLCAIMCVMQYMIVLHVLKICNQETIRDLFAQTIWYLACNIM